MIDNLRGQMYDAEGQDVNLRRDRIWDAKEFLHCVASVDLVSYLLTTVNSSLLRSTVSIDPSTCGVCFFT